MKLIELPEEQIPPAAEVIAKLMLHRVNASLAERVHEHISGFNTFWNSAEPPDAILTAMGNKAGLMLATASENIAHIGRLAALIGKTVEDFITSDSYTPRRAFIIAEDGTATLAPPAEGFDAWGREIPIPL
jgi:hypothetical protein